MNIARTILTASALVCAASAPAYAVTITTTYTPGSSALPIAPAAIEYSQNFTTAPGGGAPYVPDVTLGESTTGVVRTFRNNTPGQATRPDVSPGQGIYLAIGAGSATGPMPGSFSVDLTATAPARVFSFVLGTLDAYNSVTLTFLNSASQTFTGGQILVGSQTASTAVPVPPASGRVTYDFGTTDFLTSITFSSTRRAFEIDSLASAAPEPAAWALMILGFGIVGSALRRRRRTQVRFNFA